MTLNKFSFIKKKKNLINIRFIFMLFLLFFYKIIN